MNHAGDLIDCLIRLREKAARSERWQPVSLILVPHPLTHADSRGGLDPGERLPR